MIEQQAVRGVRLNRWRPTAAKCSKRWTARASSCAGGNALGLLGCRGCGAGRGTLRHGTWMTAPCCACWPAAAPDYGGLCAGVPAGLMAAIAGVLVGFDRKHGFVALLSGLVSADLPRPGRPARLAGAWGWGWPCWRVWPAAGVAAGGGARDPRDPARLWRTACQRLDRRWPGRGGPGRCAGLDCRRLDAGGITLAGFGIAAACFALLARLCVALLRRLLPSGPQTSAAWPRWLLLPPGRSVRGRAWRWWR